MIKESSIYSVEFTLYLNSVLEHLVKIKLSHNGLRNDFCSTASTPKQSKKSNKEIIEGERKI